MHRLNLRTERREEMVDITAAVAAAVAELGVTAGAVLVHVPHTTAAVTVNEGYDPEEGNSDSHIKAILVGSSQLIPVEDGVPALGRWQRIFFCEFDGPRSREVWVSALARN